MTDYATFKTNYTAKVWRTGDSEFSAALDGLVRKAESRIERDLRDYSLLVSVQTMLTDNDFTLPSTFRSMRSVSVFVTNRPYSDPTALAVAPDQYERYQREYDNGFLSHGGKYYTLIGTGLLRVVGSFSVETPSALNYTYNATLTPYADDPSSPYYDENPDFYEAALDMYAYDWLDDDENEAAAIAKYDQHLASMIKHNKEIEWGTGPLDYRLPGEVM